MKRTACWILICCLSACTRRTETTPQRKDIVDAVFASGDVETKNRYKVIANADGYLKEAYVSEGDTVSGGQSLFRLSGEVQQTQVLNAHDNYVYAQSNKEPNSPQLEQLNLQIQQAEEKYRLDSTNFRRYERLLPTRAVAQVDYDNARLTMQASGTNLGVLFKNKADLERVLTLNSDNAQAQLRIQKENNNYYLLRAQSKGVVLTVGKRAGELVRKGDALAEVGAGRVYLKLYIAEDDIGRVALGQPVLVSLNTDKDQVYAATITKIYPSFDDSDQAFIAEASFTGASPGDESQTGTGRAPDTAPATARGTPGSLKDGTQLQANIIIARKKNVLVIPTTYLEKGDKVLLKEGNREVAVKTGIRNLDYTEITDGLSETDKIVLPNRN